MERNFTALERAEAIVKNVQPWCRSEWLRDAIHKACIEHSKAEWERQRVTSSTYGDLSKVSGALADRVICHEWDNMTISEQRDWAIGQAAVAIAELERRRVVEERLKTAVDALEEIECGAGQCGSGHGCGCDSACKAFARKARAALEGE